MQRVYLEIADELREIGNRKHQPLPNVVSADDQVTLDTLSHLTGSQLDRAFAENVVAAHRDAIAAFQLYASSGADPELRGFADRRLPKLRTLLVPRRTCGRVEIANRCAGARVQDAGCSRASLQGRHLTRNLGTSTPEPRYFRNPGGPIPPLRQWPYDPGPVLLS